MSDNLLTVREAANYLKVHWQTVRNYINSGKLNSSKIGKNIRIRESDLQNFINKKRPAKQEHEIEIRFATKNRKLIEEKLLGIGAKIVYHGHIIDHWFTENRTKNLKEKDKHYESPIGYSIRIREQDNGYTGKITTSLEVKKLAYPPDHKVCLEEEIDIENYDKAKNFLKLINQKEMATIDKDRLVYKYKNFKVIIDDIKNFKTGVEIERITDKPHVKIITGMKDLAKLLGLDIEKEITDKSVTFLYLKKFARF